MVCKIDKVFLAFAFSWGLKTCLVNAHMMGVKRLQEAIAGNTPKLYKARQHFNWLQRCHITFTPSSRWSWHALHTSDETIARDSRMTRKVTNKTPTELKENLRQKLTTVGPTTLVLQLIMNLSSDESCLSNNK
jgi:hypothetical protein